MKLMLREGLETALILEDDVEFHRNVVNQWSSIKQKTIEKNLQWKIFLLGSCYLEASYKPDQKSMYISDQVVTYEAVACTHAYAITNSAARLFLHDVKDSNEAYDNDLFKYFGSKYQGENLVVYPGLIVQIPRSKNKGSLNSGDDLEDQTLEGQGVLSIMPK